MPSNFVGPIELLFRMSSTEAQTLADELFKRSKLVYERTVNDQLAALSHPPDFRLTNRAELQALRREANATALAIADTYNRDLARKVDAVVEAERTRGLNRQTLARRLSDWHSERAVWKDEQIERTEAARAATRAVQEWSRNSRIEDTARFILRPAESSHDDANDVAAREGRLLTQDEVESFHLPQHPNERHVPVVALPSQVDLGAVWLGG
jgi:hypothetical protein